MKDLKIIQVQVDCKDLSQEQIDKVIFVFVKNKIIKCDTITSGMHSDYYYLRKYSNNRMQVTFLCRDENFTTLTYDQFIDLFDKPKKSLKKRLKKLKDRVTLLEQKLSEKEQENNNDYKNIKQVYEALHEEVNNSSTSIKKGMRFKHINSNRGYEVKYISNNVIEFDVLNESRNIYATLVDIENEIKQGVLIPLPPAEKKEVEPQKGDICKFWNDDENSYEIARYEKGFHIMYPNVNIFTFESFKNAKVVSIDEALELFKKQLLNEK